MTFHQPDHYLASLLRYFFTSVCIVLIGLVSWNHYADLGWSSKPILMVASTAFVLISLCSGALRSRYGCLILTALVFCWLGDLGGSYQFLVGAGFFLVGHLFLIAAFWAYGVDYRRMGWAFVLLLLGSGGIASWMLPSVFAGEQVFVVGYIAALSLMTGFAMGTRGTGFHWIVSIAAIAFYVSDLLLAIGRYKEIPVDYTYFGYPIYYASCVMFAWSVMVYTNERSNSH